MINDTLINVVPNLITVSSSYSDRLNSIPNIDYTILGISTILIIGIFYIITLALKSY